MIRIGLSFMVAGVLGLIITYAAVDTEAPIGARPLQQIRLTSIYAIGIGVLIEIFTVFSWIF